MNCSIIISLPNTVSTNLHGICPWPMQRTVSKVVLHSGNSSSVTLYPALSTGATLRITAHCVCHNYAECQWPRISDNCRALWQSPSNHRRTSDLKGGNADLCESPLKYFCSTNCGLLLRGIITIASIRRLEIKMRVQVLLHWLLSGIEWVPLCIKEEAAAVVDMFRIGLSVGLLLAWLWNGLTLQKTGPWNVCCLVDWLCDLSGLGTRCFAITVRRTRRTSTQPVDKLKKKSTNCSFLRRNTLPPFVTHRRKRMTRVVESEGI